MNSKYFCADNGKKRMESDTIIKNGRSCTSLKGTGNFFKLS